MQRTQASKKRTPAQRTSQTVRRELRERAKFNLCNAGRGVRGCRRALCASSKQNAAPLTPPPPYTPPPRGAPAEDTPAQREAMAAMKAKNEEDVEADREAHNARVTPTYDFHYGKKNPFTPGNIQVEGEGFLQPGAFPTAEYCAHCHQEAYSQWRQALHSNAFRTPFYRTSVNILIRDQTRGISLPGTATAAITQ